MSLAEQVAEVWSDEWMVKTERELWITVMRAQFAINHSLVNPDNIIRSMNAVNDVNLDRIRDRERVTKHDLKARLEEFCYLSGHQQIHLGMTSADVVENLYQIRQKICLEILGLQFPANIPMRGIRGAVGSDVDQLELLGDRVDVEMLSQNVAYRWGFYKVGNAVGQTMPRSYDYQIASMVYADLEFSPWRHVVAGMLSILTDQQPWLEGDVATSCIRRYAWPHLFYYAARAKDELEQLNKGT